MLQYFESIAYTNNNVLQLKKYCNTAKRYYSKFCANPGLHVQVEICHKDSQT